MASAKDSKSEEYKVETRQFEMMYSQELKMHLARVEVLGANRALAAHSD